VSLPTRRRPRKTCPKTTPAQVAQVIKLAADPTLTRDALAERVGLGIARVYRILHEHKVPKRPGGSGTFKAAKATRVVLAYCTTCGTLAKPNWNFCGGCGSRRPKGA
jgi:hypothetical protein